MLFSVHGCLSLFGWDYDAHRLANQLALATLPENFPAFVKTPEARERIAFLSGEPDRWRNTPENEFKHINGPDHFIDLEDLAPLKMSVSNLSSFRYEFTAQQAEARKLNASSLPPIDQRRNSDKTRELAGFLPWTINEYYAKLKSSFSYLHALQEGGTPEEIANAQQNIIYIMGVMGHFVADATQPLHLTKHYNGWVGENPKDYTTANTIHSLIDGNFLERKPLDAAALIKQARPAEIIKVANAGNRSDALFPFIMHFLLEQHKMVEVFYESEKAGVFSTKSPSPEPGQKLLAEQLRRGGQMLGDLWLTAWKQAPPDDFLIKQLLKRKNRSN